VLQDSHWHLEAAAREREHAAHSAVLNWQSTLIWPGPAPWLLWAEQAQSVGVTIKRLRPTNVQTAANHARHTVSVEAEGSLAGVDAFWRELGRRGWWVTSEHMQMVATDAGALTWQAQWVVHQALASEAQANLSVTSASKLLKLQWVQRWLDEGGPSIASAHAGVPAVELSLGLPKTNTPLHSDAVRPLPWPYTDWGRMRMVGGWSRGHHVVALVEVDDWVHAVVPGMRLGPQRKEVVRVAFDGVWVAALGAGGLPRLALQGQPIATGSGP
jgi:hypothetical protein